MNFSVDSSANKINSTDGNLSWKTSSLKKNVVTRNLTVSFGLSVICRDFIYSLPFIFYFFVHVQDHIILTDRFYALYFYVFNSYRISYKTIKTYLKWLCITHYPDFSFQYEIWLYWNILSTISDGFSYKYSISLIYLHEGRIMTNHDFFFHYILLELWCLD